LEKTVENCWLTVKMDLVDDWMDEWKIFHWKAVGGCSE
jgi:hypothetical protein